MKIIAIAALVISCAATAQPVTQYQRQDADAAKTDDNKIVCKKQETIGTRLGAKKVCLTCDVRDDCLEYALMNDERFGIWGGLSERERRKLKKRAV